jgi:hypothetical protein
MDELHVVTLKCLPKLIQFSSIHPLPRDLICDV